MNLKQITYFLAVAEAGQMTAAAKQLHMAQPPLSYQLKALEDELGVRLFERGSRGVRLTGSGQQFMTYAQQIVETVAAAENAARRSGEGEIGTLALGLTSSAGDVLPKQKLQAFNRRFPQVEFALYEDNTYGILDKLRRNILDLAIVRTPFNDDGLASYRLSSDHMIAVAAASQPLPATLTIPDLKQQPLIVYRRFSSLFKTTFAEYGIPPTIAVLCDDARTALHWAQMGMGVALVPATMAALASQQSHLAVIDYEPWVTHMTLVWQPEALHNPLVARFVGQLSGGESEKYSK
ncbi:LysR family transcriptional regulator [Lacticaseibacillus paracasei]|uniref:LysR family transcriptional regulator n=1 Tax=Lacticaseibacillus paracasei TaxID=1597 RepID=UPI003C2DC04C